MQKGGESMRSPAESREERFFPTWFARGELKTNKLTEMIELQAMCSIDFPKLLKILNTVYLRQIFIF